MDVEQRNPIPNNAPEHHLAAALALVDARSSSSCFSCATSAVVGVSGFLAKAAATKAVGAFLFEHDDAAADTDATTENTAALAAATSMSAAAISASSAVPLPPSPAPA